MMAAFLVILMAWSAFLTSGINATENFLECSLTSLDMIWVLDSTSSMQPTLDLMETAAGVMYQVHVDVADEVTSEATSIFHFDDKPVSPFGVAEDECLGAKILFFADDPVDVADYDTLLGDGGDALDSQLDGVYGSMQFIAKFRNLVADGASVEDLGISPLPEHLPTWDSLSQYVDVFVLVTDGRPHTEADGPVGFPSPPDDDTYNCEVFKYPSLTQIKNLMDAYDFRLLVLTMPGDVAFYESFFSMLGTAVTVESIVAGDVTATLNNVRSGVNTLVCDCDAENFDLQLLHLQDISASYANDLPNVKSLVPNVVTQLVADFNSVEVALGKYSDKAVPPFGQKNIDTCYTLSQAFTSDTTSFFNALNDLSTLSGKDWKESQFDAVVRAVEDPSLVWTVGEQTPDGSYYYLRVVMVATDAGYHEEGDYSPSPTNTTCIGQDYPSVSAVATKLSDTGIMPLFLVTSDVYPIYTDVVAQLGISGAVQELADDSADIVEAIKSGIEDICSQETRRRRRLQRF